MADDVAVDMVAMRVSDGGARLGGGRHVTPAWQVTSWMKVGGSGLRSSPALPVGRRPHVASTRCKTTAATADRVSRSQGVPLQIVAHHGATAHAPDWRASGSDVP